MDPSTEADGYVKHDECNYDDYQSKFYNDEHPFARLALTTILNYGITRMIFQYRQYPSYRTILLLYAWIVNAMGSP